MGVSYETDQAAGKTASAEPPVDAQPAKTLVLQDIGFGLLDEQNPQALYEKIIDAAVALMGSDFASMQMFHPERGKSGELQLLAFRGFAPRAAKFWEWVNADSTCSCGNALKTGRRFIVPDIEASPLYAGTQHLETSLRLGIRAVQSTPLVGRNGHPIGMLSTHWRKPHQPSEHDLEMLDVLARQAAGLIERQQSDRATSRLAAIVETSDDAIIGKDLDGIITTWNRGAERLFGYTAQEVIGRPITILIPPEKADEEPGILARIRRGERIDHYETVRRRKDRTQIDVSLSVSPILDNKGIVVGASKIARDITERKRAEASLREADRRKGEFLAVLSHELRNPLAPMLHAVALLKLADEDVRRQACAILERQIGNMTRLVGDLQDISRISRGAIEVQKEETPLASVVHAALEISRPLVEGAGHRLEVSLPATSVSVFADRLRLAQVMSNLINNAARYTPRGGHIAVKASTTLGLAEISVRDNGIGIQAGDLSRIFDMFTQLDDSGRRASGGLGVGLALSRQLMELHGGTIEARSAGPGQGSEFIVRIPVSSSTIGTGTSA
jgi:PAS domain S-box-containing protein